MKGLCFILIGLVIIYQVTARITEESSKSDGTQDEIVESNMIGSSTDGAKISFLETDSSSISQLPDEDDGSRSIEKNTIRLLPPVRKYYNEHLVCKHTITAADRTSYTIRTQTNSFPAHYRAFCYSCRNCNQTTTSTSIKFVLPSAHWIKSSRRTALLPMWLSL